MSVSASPKLTSSASEGVCDKPGFVGFTESADRLTTRGVRLTEYRGSSYPVAPFSYQKSGSDDKGKDQNPEQKSFMEQGCHHLPPIQHQVLSGSVQSSQWFWE